jgi:hypothetical protein
MDHPSEFGTIREQYALDAWLAEWKADVPTEKRTMWFILGLGGLMFLGGPVIACCVGLKSFI